MAMNGHGARASERTPLWRSRTHAPSATARRVFNVVLRSGHFQVPQSHRMERPMLPGHELLYCVSGSGYVLSENKPFRVDPLHLAWVAGSCARWADQQTSWEALWIRVDGYQVEQAWEVLGVPEKPVFAGLPEEATRRLFRRIYDLLAEPSVTDAALNCEVAELLGYLIESRAAEIPRIHRRTPEEAREIRVALEHMATDLKRSWRAGELAALCGLSERHFFRRFKVGTGISPIDWLRRARIRLAQTRLLEGAERVKEISEQVGYNDVFFFSRDFKQQTGFSPSAYRRERLPRGADSGRLEDRRGHE